MINRILILLCLIISSCSAQKSHQFEYRINSSKIPCQAVGPTECLQIQKGEMINSKEWQTFYSQINGFQFVNGYLYNLIVREEKLSPKNVAADASSISYTLIEVLEKKPDPKFRIHDIWVLERISGEEIIIGNNTKRPQIEINVTKMKLLGNTGCNQISGNIIALDEDQITFGPVMQTRMACPDMRIPNLFSSQLNLVQHYHIENRTLTLLDSLQHPILSFKKVD